MVVGLDRFQTFFADYADRYTLIGGAACDLLFTDANLPFRATKDLDIVLCVEVIDAAFGARFKEFLDAAGYQRWAMSEGERKFYRFEQPSDAAFPAMIELFARPPAELALPEDDRYVRLSVEDEVVSLSALLLHADYYDALLANRREQGGVTILTEDMLVPFKARAFLDLTERKAKGEAVDSRNITKHRNDIFRLLQLMPETRRVTVAQSLKDDLRGFAEAMANETFDPGDFKVPITKDDGVALLRAIYQIET
ncbi:MAG: hypothetical protein K2X34_10650 [Hyphomonadaceae bacterium]|nr:hypothetical protein [Hyphomonadaceae bacterium]